MKRRAEKLFLLGGLFAAAALGALWFVQTPYLPAGLLFVGIALLAAGAALLRREVYAPLQKLEETAAHWQGTEPAELRREMQAIGGAVQGTAKAMLGQMEGLEGKLQTIRRETEQETEQQLRRKLTAEIAQAALPHTLPSYPSRENFEVGGLIGQSKTPSCAFYDYFYVDPGLLCVVVGQTPGAGVAEALYMVVAQTAIRSRLRQGLSLDEMLSDVNKQLYDLGNKNCLQAFVGTLNTSDGRFRYISAGAQTPLLMQNEGQYEWLKILPHAALGLNQNVSYTMGELRLRQGDRLFCYTSGLSAVCDRDGRPFGESALRVALNRSRSKTHTPEETLRFIADEAAVYCPNEKDQLGYAALQLEYRKGTRELAHCDLPAEPASAQQLAAFLSQQFEKNGIGPRRLARVALLVDELFALCCRRSAPGSVVTTECGIAPDGMSVTIRMLAATGGADPLTASNDEPAENALSFIRSQADYLTFKAGPERDTITMVCFLTE